MLPIRCRPNCVRSFSKVWERMKMKRFSNTLLSGFVAAMVIFGLTTAAEAQRRTEREVQDAVRTLNSQIDDLQYNIDFEIKNNGAADSLENAEAGVRELKQKLDTFEQNVSARRENRDDINAIITAARSVDRSLAPSNVNRAIKGDWADVKRSVESLASKYGVTANWSGGPSVPTRTASVPSVPRSTQVASGGLNGTYRLDAARSEDVSNILAGTKVSGSNKQDLESKLEAPEEVAIHIAGDRVTLASSKAAPVTIVADGREKSENTSGRTIKVKATLRGDILTVSSLGGETDYTITFASADRGQTLKVTRRITTDYLTETIFAESLYSKTDAVAKLGIDNGSASPDDDSYSSNDPSDNRSNGNTPSVVTPRIGEFIVPNGTRVSGVLENPIDTKVSQNNDRFRLTVQSPDEFRGAIIEGYISGVGRSGQVSGRSNVTFNFTKITLRDGKSYDFAGNLLGIKDTQGKDVKIDAEGTAKGDSQTKETVKRGGIGAGAGALIGAILGGGKGAAIGAVIGGGAGAGSVVVQGRDDIKLQQGSIITVSSSSPIRDNQVSEND